MQKVKNSPRNYVKRAQVGLAYVADKRVTSSPKKRTAADFANAVIDSTFYVTFCAGMKKKKTK